MKLDSKFAESLTNALIERIKTIEGNWEKPWFDNAGMRPKNLDGKAYNGLNKFLLSMLDGGRDIPVYMTFLRAKREGLSVLSGEKSLPVQYANKVAFHKETKKSISIEKYEELTPSEKEEYNIAFMMKHYNVFNVDQTNMKEVNPELYEQLKEQVKLEQRVLKETASPLFSLVENQSWYTPIKLDQVDRAYYTPFQDEIHLPKREFFKSDDLFYSTMLHEMSHSTGHKSRLNREIHNEFGSPKYSREELVAELSSAIVGQQYGVSKTILEDNAHYLHSWLDAIKQEPEFLNEVLEDVLNASNMIVDKVELVQKENIDKAMDTKIKKATKQGKSAYDLQAQYSRINGEYPFSVTTDREKQVVHRIKQAENIIKVYNENISDYLGENYYQDKEKVYQVIPKEIYAKPKVMERTIEQREYSTEQRSSEVEEPKINQDILPLAEIYAHEENMTLKSLEKRNISVPEDISNAIKRREEILGRLVRNSDPTQEQSLLKEKLEIEDNIRTQLKDFIQNKLQFNIAPHVPVAEKMSALEQSGDYLETNMSRELVLHDGLYRKLPIVQTMPDKAENRAKLEAEDVEYEVLPTNQLRYKGVARLQEGYAMEDNKQNRDFLEANKISFDKLNDNKLFVSMRVQKMALLLASSIILSPVFGIAIMYILNKTRTLDRLLKDRQFTNDEAKRLAAGETIRKTGVVEGKQVEKYYFVDDTTNQLRSIPVNEVRLNTRINGVQLSIKELDDLRNGNIVTGYDEATKQYYEAKLDLNSKSSVQMGFKDLKATKEFNYVPKPNSPDADKKAYVQIHGAQGVNDIWEMGGVNLERDSFLDKYDIEGFYKDYQSSIEDKNFAQAEEKSQAIKDALSESQQMKRSL